MALHKILCVDDEADMRQITQLALQSMGGFEVALCADGSEAIAAIEQSMPDLVLLDVMMPGLSGPETIKVIHENYPDLSVAVRRQLG
ncbi:MAG: response regulator [Methylococcales bacterium]|mgnify:CR=1 FL=1|jgi:two-component system, OmpR family, response regulator|nr:response regulator [Methylococcales bacterium]